MSHSINNKQNSKEEPSEAQKSSITSKQFQEDTKRAVIGGGLAAVVTALGGWLVGEVTGGEGHILLNMTLETTRSFCGTVTLALGNILALMLTLLSLSANSNVDLKWSHYHRVKQIAWLVTVLLIGSILIYLLLNIPLEKSDQSSAPDFGYLYYFTLIISSSLGGALISVVLMLYNTVNDIIHAVGPGKEEEDLQSNILKTEEEE
ncbi:hypothetical protein [Fodinibius sediminis]|uniref:Uncharacterized protein n=2 Tax=Fodinibius sediminis TaxID=1214077 RepID=A0A521FEJ3_9BACT|nr:hypothetical protein [Fodinibius sediminis]SMO94081.1 hypothetical protein SAMN06265218_1301 [Fodinibius sediminis]